LQALAWESPKQGERTTECCRVALSLRKEFSHRRRGAASAARL